jgi:hypothetical protein
MRAGIRRIIKDLLKDGSVLCALLICQSLALWLLPIILTRTRLRDAAVLERPIVLVFVFAATLFGLGLVALTLVGRFWRCLERRKR